MGSQERTVPSSRAPAVRADCVVAIIIERWEAWWSGQERRDPEGPSELGVEPSSSSEVPEGRAEETHLASQLLSPPLPKHFLVEVEMAGLVIV